MAKNQSKPFKINSNAGVKPVVIDAKAAHPADDGFITVDLKYYNGKPQCFSDWSKSNLKAFTKWALAVKNEKPTTIAQNGGLEYKPHKASPKLKGCSRPSAISKDINLYEMRAGGKARVHGFLFKETFYLVWLDRNHEAFPSGK